MDEFNRPTIRAAALEGSISQRYVENLASKVKLVRVPDYDTGVKLVLDKNVDLMFADYAVCLLSRLRNPDQGLATLDLPLTIEPVGIALPPGEFLFHNLIDNYLSALMTAGVLDDLETKWFNEGA